MIVFKSVSFVIVACVVLCAPLSGQERATQNEIRSCSEFVESFYSWYVAKAASEKQEMAGDLALKYRPNLFSPAIVQALQEDDRAQEKAGNDLVGLDGDPFAGGDGIADKYVIGTTKIENGRCWVAVHGV